MLSGLYLRKVQEQVDKFSNDINTKSSFTVEDIVVKEGNPRNAKGADMATIKGLIEVYQFLQDPADLESCILHELGHRVMGGLNPNFALELVARNIVTEEEFNSRKGLKEMLGFFKDILVDIYKIRKGEGMLADYILILEEGFAEYFSCEVLPGICSVKHCRQEPNDWYLSWTKGIEYYYGKLLEKDPSYSRQTLFDIRADISVNFNWPRLGINHHPAPEFRYAVGYNFFHRIAEEDKSLVAGFVKKPYADGDPQLKLGNLVSPKGFAKALAKNRK